MAINRDPAEWFVRPDRMDNVEYGILKTADGWLVLRREYLFPFSEKRANEVARVDSRQAAIGYIKLLKEN